MRKTKWSLKLYKLQLYSIEGTLFGGPAGVKLLKLVEQAFAAEFGIGKGRDSASYCTYRSVKYKKYETDIDFLNLCQQLGMYALAT